MVNSPKSQAFGRQDRQVRVLCGLGPEAHSNFKAGDVSSREGSLMLHNPTFTQIGPNYREHVGENLCSLSGRNYDESSRARPRMGSRHSRLCSLYLVSPEERQW
jgi:hypothetical protein